MDIRYVSLGRHNGERLMTLAVSKNKLKAELAARQKRKNGTENMRSNFITMFQYEYKIYLHNMVTLLQENFEWVDTRRATWILSNGGNEDARKNIKSKLYRAKRNPERSGFIKGKHWKKDSRNKWHLLEILLLFPPSDEDVEYSKVFKIFENLSEGNLDLIDEIGEDNLLELLMKLGFGHS